MKRFFQHSGSIIGVLTFLLLFSSCITYRFIRDEKSLKMERQLHGERAGRVVGDSFLVAILGFLSAITNMDLVDGFLPDQKLSHLTLSNVSSDTLQVNMLAGQALKDSQYCDFRDIRIPPGSKCRLLVPVNCNYNLYFSNTINSEEDDEFMEINTVINLKLKLFPGMTFQKDSITIH